MDIFRNPTKMLPKQADPQIVRVPMTQNDLGGRTDHIGQGSPSAHDRMGIEHVKSK